MTVAATDVSSADLHVAVSGELIDALIEALVLPLDPPGRSAVICAVVQEMCDTVEWLQESEIAPGRATDDELRSVRRLATAAEAHLLRMAHLARGG